MFLDIPAQSQVPIAPHHRVQHIFYCAPFIKELFEPFLQKHSESQLLESDQMVEILSHAYLCGLERSEDFWKEAPDSMESAINCCELMRRVRGKVNGARLWEHFLVFLYQLTGERLPSRKSREPIWLGDKDERSMIQNALVQITLLLFLTSDSR